MGDETKKAILSDDEIRDSRELTVRVQDTINNIGNKGTGGRGSRGSRCAKKRGTKRKCTKKSHRRRKSRRMN